MSEFDKSLLHFFVGDALRSYSENFIPPTRENPSRFVLNGLSYSAHLSYVHDSGENRDNDDETRVQISRRTIENQRRNASSGDRVAFLGFFAGGKVFVAWDPNYVLSLDPAEVGSIYARQSMLSCTILNGADVRSFRSTKIGKNFLTVALPSQALGLYLENVSAFHALSSLESVTGLIRSAEEALPREGIVDAKTIQIELPKERVRIEYTRSVYKRDPRFRSDVLNAYGQACCICETQLGLVEAAHIIPHAAEGGVDLIQNGLAMCANHHRLYDSALLLPGPGHKLHFNGERAKFLDAIGQGGGLDEIRGLHGTSFRVPDEKRHHPSEDNLRRGLELRLG